jgi:hypothetical protein
LSPGALGEQLAHAAVALEHVFDLAPGEAAQ